VLLRICLAATLAAMAIGLSAPAVFAFGVPAPCVTRVEGVPFAAWGDWSSYFLMPNGGFEYGSYNWALSGGAQVVDGNEPYYVTGGGSHSLRLVPGSTAESRTICVGAGEDVIRLFVANPHVQGAILHVDAMVRNPSTGAMGWACFDVNGDVPSATWAPTMRLKVPALLGTSGTQELTLTFSLRGTPATWNIDDVFIDPFRSY
jgi:hypothetical protein